MSFLFGGQPQTSEPSSASATTPTFASLAANAPATSSGVKGASQEGIDRTAVDFSLFSSGTQSQAAASTAFPSFSQSQGSPSKVFESAPVFGAPANLGSPQALGRIPVKSTTSESKTEESSTSSSRYFSI